MTTGPNETLPPRPSKGCARCGVPLSGPSMYAHYEGPFCAQCGEIERKKHEPKRSRGWLARWLASLLRG